MRVVSEAWGCDEADGRWAVVPFAVRHVDPWACGFEPGDVSMGPLSFVRGIKVYAPQRDREKSGLNEAVLIVIAC